MDLAEFQSTYASQLASAKSKLDASAHLAVALDVYGKPNDPLASRVGGPLIWPDGADVPRDATGGPMIFVA